MEEKTATNQSIPAPPPPVSESASAPPPRRRFRPVLVVILALAVLAAAAVYYVEFIAPYETTDDAFIESYVAFVSPRISGQVVRLLVREQSRRRPTAG